MFSMSRERNLAVLIVIFLSMKGAAGFFVKHVQSGMCINDTSIKQGDPESWGHLIFLELSNNCLDPAAQFRFRDNGAMLNLERQRCLVPGHRAGTGYYLEMLYIFVPKEGGVNKSCDNDATSRAITQTSWGGLSISHKGYRKSSYETWCAVSGHHPLLSTNQGIDPYIKLTTPCADDPDKRFNFGSVTCYGDKVENANCPKDQYMVVKNASYRGLSPTKTCGLSDDYSCEVNVACLVKKQCDGQHECNITVDNNLVPANSCGFTRYLYFEYQCIDSPTPYLCAPDGPPQNVQVTAESSSSLSVTWEPPEKDKRNGMIVNYTVCISHEESKPCFKEYTTKEQMLVISSLNVSTKYYVRVLASTKVGRGIYSESEGKFTNGKQPDVATNQAQRTLTFTLEIPSKDFTHFYVVVLKLNDGKEPTSSASYENNELVTYAEARKSTNPKPYIAAVVTSSGADGNMFILGDGRNTNEPTARRGRSTSRDYYNGPLEPGASYSIFQRIFIDKEGEYYSTDWSPASKTIGKKRVGSDSGAEDAGGKYLVAGIIVLAILLVISLVIIAYLIYQNRRLKSSKENPENKDKEKNNSQDIHENPETVKDDGNYEQVENEQSTYTALNRSGMAENDDHLYTHLNEVGSDYVIQLKTEM